MKITRKELLRLNNAMAALAGRPFSVKFSYFVAKNKVSLRDEMIALEEARKPSDNYKIYDAQRGKLAQEYADKYEDGSAKIQDNSFVITAKVDEFQKELEELRVKHKEAIEEYNNQMKDFEELLNSEVKFEGMKIDFKDIPSSIEPSILEVLILCDLIFEDE